MSFPFDTNDQMFAGLDSVLDTVQNQFWWGRESQQTFVPAVIAAATTDAGNTVTTTLRGGLLLGKITATGFLKAWNPTGTDGSEVIFGILAAPVSMVDGGSTADRYTYVWVKGNLLSDNILIPASATEGIVGASLEFHILNQFVDRGVLLDRHVQYGHPRTLRPRYLTAAEITADAVAVLASDHGRTFLMTGADGTTTVTLPAPQVGLSFTVAATVAQTVTIALTSGALVIAGSVTATALSLTLGESATFIGISTGLYLVQNHEATD